MSNIKDRKERRVKMMRKSIMEAAEKLFFKRIGKYKFFGSFDPCYARVQSFFAEGSR